METLPGSGSDQQSKRSRSLTEELVAKISKQITDGGMQPGEKLPTESMIMNEHGVSRTVVREAISRLQASGLVETRHGVGTFVLAAPIQNNFRIDPATIVTLKDVIAVLELRISLEVEAAGLAAQRRTEEQLAVLETTLHELINKKNTSSSSISNDFKFHSLIAEATGNPYFKDIFNHLGTTIIPRTRIDTAGMTGSDQTQYLARVNREHEDIFAAIARKDPDAARTAMRLHLINSRERMRALHEAYKHRVR